MDDNMDIQKLLTAVGSLAELLGVFKKEMKRNGFEDWEIVTLCGKLMDSILGAGRNEE